MRVLVFDQPKPGHFRRGVEVIAKALDGVPLMAPVRQARWQLVRHKGPLVIARRQMTIRSIFSAFAFCGRFSGVEPSGLSFTESPEYFPCGPEVWRGVFCSR